MCHAVSEEAPDTNRFSGPDLEEFPETVKFAASGTQINGLGFQKAHSACIECHAEIRPGLNGKYCGLCHASTAVLRPFPNPNVQLSQFADRYSHKAHKVYYGNYPDAFKTASVSTPAASHGFPGSATMSGSADIVGVSYIDPPAERGLRCSTCHDPAAGGVKIQLPMHKNCFACHGNEMIVSKKADTYAMNCVGCHANMADNDPNVDVKLKPVGDAANAIAPVIDPFRIVITPSGAGHSQFNHVGGEAKYHEVLKPDAGTSAGKTIEGEMACLFCHTSVERAATRAQVMEFALRKTDPRLVQPPASACVVCHVHAVQMVLPEEPSRTARVGCTVCHTAADAAKAPPATHLLGDAAPARPATHEPTPSAAKSEAPQRVEPAASSGETVTYEIASGVSVDMVVVPPGTFTMGSAAGEADDGPAHRVTITNPYQLGKFEVTQRQWNAVMGSNPSRFQGDDLPVEQVSFDDVQEFIKRLNAQTDGLWRLPTEAEWEYACRAGSTSDDDLDLDSKAWYGANSKGRTHPVGTKEPNSLGLYDMRGNVLEWCEDWDVPYTSQDETDPVHTSVAASKSASRIVRGGSWNDDSEAVRPVYRFWLTPRSTNALVGFRLARNTTGGSPNRPKNNDDSTNSPVVFGVARNSTGGSPNRPKNNDDTTSATRQMWDTEFVVNRPKSAPAAPRPVKKPRKYKPAPTITGRPSGREPPETVPSDMVESLVGVTLWRLRAPVASDGDGSRMLVHRPATTGPGNEVALTPERIDIAGPLVVGQFVRLAIESPRAGYLYVIDREVYADGRRGVPTLIFPTTRLYNGDNRVEAGHVVEIPAQTDNPEYFTVTRERPDQVSEAITILVTPEPIESVVPGEFPKVLDVALLETWERDWAVAADRLDLEGGEGQVYTVAESRAGADPKALLTQDDPLPQTLYRMVVKKGAPVMVTVVLPVRK